MFPLRIVGFALLFIAAVVLFIAPRPAYAISSGCSTINSGVLNYATGPGSGPSMDYFSFNTGEVITARATLGSATNAQFQIEKGGVVAGPTSAPGMLTYNVPSTGAIPSLKFRNLGSSNGTINWNISCSAGSGGGGSGSGGGSPSSLGILGVPSTPLPPPPKWFDPKDARVDGWAHDLLVIYCNQPDQVVVYGIDSTKEDSKKGFPMAVFSYKALQAAGNKGLTQPLGINGSISVSLRKGWFWIAWNGGKFGATGRGQFVKNINAAQCTFGQ